VRRTRTRETTPIVAASRIAESAITEIAPGPGPLAWTGRSAGIVSAGGASTGGREPATGSPVLDGAGESDCDGAPCEGGTATGAGLGFGFGCDRGVGDGARDGAAVGVGAGDP
jgi:hypothetical protein